MQDNFIKYLLLLCFAYVYVRLLIPYIGFFARFMFNEPVRWDKYIEKPRLVFYGSGLILMHTSYSSILEYANNPSSFYFIGNCFIFLGGMAISQVTWSQKFKKVFIPSIKEKLRQHKNFNVSASKHHLNELYNELVRYDIVIQEQTRPEDFITVFTEDWGTHNSKVHFKLDAPSCREFYELLRATFPKNSLTLIDFIKRSDTIRRDDGKNYNYNTVKNASYRTQISSSSDDLKAVFSKFS